MIIGVTGVIPTLECKLDNVISLGVDHRIVMRNQAKMITAQHHIPLTHMTSIKLRKEKKRVRDVRKIKKSFVIIVGEVAGAEVEAGIGVALTGNIVLDLEV